MRTLVLTALAAGLLVTPPAALAHPDRHFLGSCQFAAFDDGSNDDETTWTGLARVVVVATDAAGGAAPDTPITVRCVLVVNEVERETVLAASGIGIAAGAAPLSYQADLSDVVYLCAHVTVGGEEHVRCPEPFAEPILPRWLVALVEGAFRTVDGAVCSALGTAAPGVPGVVDVEPGGDTYVAGELWYDCPPWETA